MNSRGSLWGGGSLLLKVMFFLLEEEEPMRVAHYEEWQKFMFFTFLF